MNEEQRRQQHLIDEMRSNGMSFCRDIGIVFDATTENDLYCQRLLVFQDWDDVASFLDEIIQC